MMRSAIRHNLRVSASHLHCLAIIRDQYLTPSPLDSHKQVLFSSVSTYVTGAFDNQIWKTEIFSNNIVRDFTEWTFDEPLGVFKTFAFLACATLCCQLGMHVGAQLLLESGLKELPTYLNDYSPEALLTLIVSLGFFRDHMPTEREKLLDYCISTVEEANPLGVVLRRIRDAEHTEHTEPQSLDSDFRPSLLHNVATIFCNKLRDRLGPDKLGYAILQPLHVTGEKEDFESLAWDDPGLVQKKDQKFFNSDLNIKRFIVLAVERFGVRELLQIEDTLKRQRSLAETNKDLERVDHYLKSLQRPIQRIGFRDCFDDEELFRKYWKRTTADWESEQEPQCPNHIMDMLQGIGRFEFWGDTTEVMMIRKHLDHVFLALAANLGKRYRMVEGASLYAVPQ